MDEELRGLLVGRIQDVCNARAREGSFAINEAAQQVIDEMGSEDNKRWKELRDHFAEQGVVHMVNRVITQAKAADPAQRNLPGLESMPLLITSEGAASRPESDLNALRREGIDTHRCVANLDEAILHGPFAPKRRRVTDLDLGDLRLRYPVGQKTGRSYQAVIQVVERRGFCNSLAHVRIDKSGGVPKIVRQGRAPKPSGRARLDCRVVLHWRGSMPEGAKGHRRLSNRIHPAGQ